MVANCVPCHQEALPTPLPRTRPGGVSQARGCKPACRATTGPCGRSASPRAHPATRCNTGQRRRADGLDPYRPAAASRTEFGPCSTTPRDGRAATPDVPASQRFPRACQLSSLGRMLIRNPFEPAPEMPKTSSLLDKTALRTAPRGSETTWQNPKRLAVLLPATRIRPSLPEESPSRSTPPPSTPFQRQPPPAARPNVTLHLTERHKHRDHCQYERQDRPSSPLKTLRLLTYLLKFPLQLVDRAARSISR